MINLILFIICFLLSWVNLFAFPNNPIEMRLIMFFVCLICACVNVPFVIRYLKEGK